MWLGKIKLENMKGISSIIAVLMLVAITIALVGMLGVYIYGLFRAGIQGISVEDFECVEGSPDKAQIWIQNIGDRNVTVTVTQTAPSGATVDTSQFVIEPGQVYTFQDTCEGTGRRYCVYKFRPSLGKSVTASVLCT